MAYMSHICLSQHLNGFPPSYLMWRHGFLLVNISINQRQRNQLVFKMWFICLEIVCFYSKDPEGSEVDVVEENDYTGIISFPDFKIPSNPRYFKVFFFFLIKFSVRHTSGTFGYEVDNQSNRAT